MIPKLRKLKKSFTMELKCGDAKLGQAYWKPDAGQMLGIPTPNWFESSTSVRLPSCRRGVMNIDVSRGEQFKIIVLNAGRMLARLGKASRDDLETAYPNIIMQEDSQHPCEPWSRSQTANSTHDGLRPRIPKNPKGLPT